MKQQIHAYQLNDFNLVCAENIEQAKTWFMRVTGLSEHDAIFPGYPKEIDLTTMMPRYNKSIKELISQEWDNEPFALTIFKKIGSSRNELKCMEF